MFTNQMLFYNHWFCTYPMRRGHACWRLCSFVWNNAPSFAWHRTELHIIWWGHFNSPFI